MDVAPETRPLAAGVRFDPHSGLLPAVVQDAADGRVLMVGWMNAEALARTVESGRVTFWSRSRERLWEKGESSGNVLDVLSIESDCDGDAVLVRARPHGPTCHTGTRSCFDAGTSEGGDAAPSLGAALAELAAIVAERERTRPADSYTARLFTAGRARIAQKVGEEAVEAALAAIGEPGRLAAESADLLYHLVVLWRAAGVEPEEVAAELAGRR
ncbi:MAG: bifunctional phosphoribosyl-AMP cyclohydrolase/phosphoribosyl-ATP diphosphatase HisIE [Gemmatimonadota bacterium]|nr:bifunctional phosphoribosyl-AMP cyclohydrolase/phosphoribosyl-ATP diphosphatase HisIE [Gemmatimonadota bacterium]